MPFWNALMLNRPRDRWNDADLANAAALARAQCDVERLWREIDAEGDVIEGKRTRSTCLSTSWCAAS